MAPSMTNRKWWEDRMNCRIDSLGRNVPAARWGISGQTDHRALLPNASAQAPRQALYPHSPQSEIHPRDMIGLAVRPSVTASFHSQSTTSCPCSLAVFGAMKGSVAMVGASVPRLQEMRKLGTGSPYFARLRM